MESEGAAGLGGGPRPEDDQRAEIRARIQRFARIRSGHRALPMTASELEFTAERDRATETLRNALQTIAGGASEALAGETKPGAGAVLTQADRTLDEMESDLLARMDRVSFADLRAEVPRAIARRREDVIALVDVLIADRDDLVHRLSKLEYLITVLATEEVDGERKVLHDPVRLTPSLESIANEQIPSEESEAVAIELFQAACPQSGHDDLESLRSSRDRKAALGLLRLAPNVLRAVVTYNARVFNRLASSLSADERADSLLEELVRDPGEVDSGCAPGLQSTLDDTDEIWSRVGRDEPLTHHEQSGQEETDIESVYDNARLEDVLVALRRRLGGIPIGSCTSERVALALDVSRLDQLEREAICDLTRDEDASIVAYAALVGLLLRDLGAVRSDLAELGVDEEELSSAWLLELDRDFGRLVSRELANPERYSHASKLSGIKTKHLLAPLSSRRQRRPGVPNDGEDPKPVGDAEPESSRSTRTSRHEDRRTKDHTSDPSLEQVGRAWRALVSSHQARTWASAAVLLVAIFLAANVVTQRPTTVETLDSRALAQRSPFLESAYRNEQGRGRTLIGRLDEDYGDLPPERQRAVARELVDRLETEGIDEIMLYGPRGRLLVHSANGELRRPAP